MAQPLPPVAYDPANILFGPSPCRLDTATATAKDGSGLKLGMVTVRTPSTTTTVLLSPEQLREWLGLLGDLADKIGGGLAPASIAEVIRLGNAPR